MDYSAFGVLAIKAIQEQQDIIEELSMEINSINAQIRTKLEEQMRNDEKIMAKLKTLEAKL